MTHRLSLGPCPGRTFPARHKVTQTTQSTYMTQVQRSAFLTVDAPPQFQSQHVDVCASPRWPAKMAPRSVLLRWACQRNIIPSGCAAVEDLGSQCRGARTLSGSRCLTGMEKACRDWVAAKANAPTFAHCLSPPETLSPRCRDLVRAPTCGPKKQLVWSVLLHPLEREKTSKTRNFDESLLIDVAYFT